MESKYKKITEPGNTYEDNLLLIIDYLEKEIQEQKTTVKEKLEEITEEYNKLDKRNLNTANIIRHQYNSMRKVLEEVLKEFDSNDEVNHE